MAYRRSAARRDHGPSAVPQYAISASRCSSSIRRLRRSCRIRGGSRRSQDQMADAADRSADRRSPSRRSLGGAQRTRLGRHRSSARSPRPTADRPRSGSGSAGSASTSRPRPDERAVTRTACRAGGLDAWQTPTSRVRTCCSRTASRSTSGTPRLDHRGRRVAQSAGDDQAPPSACTRCATAAW